MKKIHLTKGKYAVVDNEDFKELSKYKWQLNGGIQDIYYAIRWISVKERVKYNGVSAMMMHRQILGLGNAGSKVFTDHINNNGLDNRKCNLRICNNSQNSMSRRIMSNNKSGYTGVSWNNQRKKWVVQIKANQKSYNLGYFSNKFYASKIYKEKAKELFGEFAG